MTPEDLFETAYLFLLIDQHDSGLWGRTMTLGKKYITPEDAAIQEQNCKVESLSNSYIAVDAILNYTSNRNNSFIKKTIREIPNHRDKAGGYGTRAENISYREPRQVLANTRHTATVILTRLLVENQLDESIVQSTEYMIKNTKQDGGWGIPDRDSDHVSTTYVLRALTSLKEKKLKPGLSWERKFDEIIDKGVKWLQNIYEKNNDRWFYDEDDICLSDTAEVLCQFPNLREYNEELYKKSLQVLANAQNSDNGWPCKKGEESNLRETIWIANALVRSEDLDIRNKVQEGIKFILEQVVVENSVKTLESSHWALILNLSRLKNVHITHERDLEMQEHALRIIQKMFRENNASIQDKERYLDKRLGKFKHLKWSIMKAVTNSPYIQRDPLIVRWYNKVPRSVKIIVGTSAGLLALISTIIHFFK